MNERALLFISIIFISIGRASAADIVWNRDLQHPDAFVLTEFKFPKNFQWGAATSAYQIEGAATVDNEFCQNNWTRDPKKVHASVSCDHWRRYKEDVQLMKKAGLNTYRFSIEWSKIEPEQDVFCAAALQHYVDLVDELLKNGITPVVCLFHHTWPTWFDDKGAFDHEENCQHFVKFAEYVFNALKDKVQFWMTYNEPVGFVMASYLIGDYPPYKKGIKLPGIVLKNMLNTHVTIYQSFKTQCPNAQIGFPKVMHPIEPYHPWNPAERLLCGFFSYLLHDVVIQFFKTGKFNWAYIVTDYNALAPHSLDYLGVNYYTHTYLCQKITGGFCMAKKPDETLADNGKAVYPEGLAWAIKKAAEIGKPLYITENGIATNDDALRDFYYREHLYIACQAIEQGYDIRGYTTWALMDTYGWNKGFDKAGYGLYNVDFACNSLRRTMRRGSENFVSFMQKQTGQC